MEIGDVKRDADNGEDHWSGSARRRPGRRRLGHGGDGMGRGGCAKQGWFGGFIASGGVWAWTPRRRGAIVSRANMCSGAVRSRVLIAGAGPSEPGAEAAGPRWWRGPRARGSEEGGGVARGAGPR